MPTISITPSNLAGIEILDSMVDGVFTGDTGNDGAKGSDSATYWYVPAGFVTDGAQASDSAVLTGGAVSAPKIIPTVAATKLVVNEIDMSAFSMWVECPQGWGSAARIDQLVTAPGGAGQIMVPSAAQWSARQWSVSGMLIAGTALDARDLWDQAKAVLSNTWLEVMILPWTDRICVCRFQGIEWQPVRIEDRGFRFTLTFQSPSAYLVAPLVDSYGLSAGEEIVLHLGTAPSPYIAQIIGPATNPTLLYRDVTGSIQGKLMFTVTLAAREWLQYDSQTHAIQRVSDLGITSEGARYLDPGTQEFHLDPQDGTLTQGPTLSLDSGAAIIYARRAWL